MTSKDELIRRIEEQCDLPDSWNAFETGPEGTIEVSDFDGKRLEEAAVELINGRHVKEVVMYHANMPGMASAYVEGGLESLDEPAHEIPSQLGVLQFEHLDDALEAMKQLTDPDTLADIANHRSPIESDEPLSVLDAVAEVTDVDVETVDDTLTSI